MWRGGYRYGEIHEIRRDTGRCARDTGRYGQIRADTGRWRRIRGDRGRYGGIAQKIVQTRAWSLSVSLSKFADIGVHGLSHCLTSLSTRHKSQYSTVWNTRTCIRVTPLTVTPGTPAARPHRTRARQKNLKRTPKSICVSCVCAVCQAPRASRGFKRSWQELLGRTQRRCGLGCDALYTCGISLTSE